MLPIRALRRYGPLYTQSQITRIERVNVIALISAPRDAPLSIVWVLVAHLFAKLGPLEPASVPARCASRLNAQLLKRERVNVVVMVFGVRELVGHRDEQQYVYRGVSAPADTPLPQFCIQRIESSAE